MFDWFYHLLGLTSPRELLRLNEQLHKDMRKGELQLARAMARIAEAERKEGV